MRYAAQVEKDGKHLIASFPDCPGCFTQASDGQSIEAQAADALKGWLEATLDGGEAPPRPKSHKGADFISVDVPLVLATKISLRWARMEAGLTQTQLAELVGVKQPMIAKAENPDENSSLETLQKIIGAIPGARAEFSISFERKPPRRSALAGPTRRKLAGR